jgi:5-methyltetrahydropteroyltriglutamate--homocysteine methyltransferase
MQRSLNRILTTHVGSLPRPPRLVTMMQTEAGTTPKRQRYEQELHAIVADIVRRQVESGVDVVNDGEMGKPGFIHYINNRLSGFEPRKTGPLTGSYYGKSREGLAFPEYYETQSQIPGSAGKASNMESQRWVCTAPIRYKGQEHLRRELDTLRATIAEKPTEDAFVTSIAPADVEHWNQNEYYKSDAEYLNAIAEALHEEYKAIVDAGFILQVDNPLLATYYVLNPNASIAECRRWAESRVEALNHALEGIPEDRVRYHTCYSINMGPRVHDIELKHIVDLILRIRAGAYSFEAGNARHEHEWRVWKDTRVPEGKILIPGVITHSSVLVEHPELIAERIIKFASIVGRENVIAGADCGFASFATYCEVHPTVVWAKFSALKEGARLASKQLWR